ncbi:MAG: CARDB domain-containing protein [Candidatus Thermoplasmatota archaeon]|nr:CARDB domain-containing protein [Candidatus Thermoplasmatota archaeon]
MLKWIIIFLLLSLTGTVLVVLTPGGSSAEATRSSYGVVLKVIDQPYFPNDGKWTGFLNITVTNTCPDKSDTFRLEATQKPAGWDVIVLEPTIDVGTSPPTGPEKSTTLLISCPKMEKQGTYRIAIKGTSQGDPAQYHSIYIDVEVMLVPFVNVEGPINVEETDIDPANGIPDYLEGDPGDYVTYDFQIRNVGNGEEAYFISLDSPNNWWHEIQGPSFTQTLSINQTAIKRVKVKIPGNAEMGDTDVLKFIATSQVDPKLHHLATVETRVKQIFSLGLEAPLYSTFSYPHSEVELDFNITNKGNGADDTARMEMKSISPDWIWEFDLSNIGPNGIPRYGKARCVLSLVIPKTSLNRTYSLTIETYTSLKNVPDDSLTLNITIFQEFDLNLNLSTNTAKVFPGEEISYNFTVENPGNGDDNYSIQLLKEGEINVTSWCELDTSYVELGNDFSHEIFFNVRIPELSKAGIYVISVQVISNGARKMQLVVTETISFSFEVMKQYSLEMTKRKGDELLSINSDEIDPEKRLDVFHFNVSNLGNAQDIVLFTIDYPDIGGWSPPDFMISQVMLQYRETRGNLILTVRAPFGIAIGEYHFTVQVRSTRDPSENPASDSIDFSVKIVRFDIDVDKIISLDSRLVDSSVNVSDSEIHSIELKIWVRNVGNLDIDRFNVSLFINNDRIAPYRTREIFDFKSGMKKELTFDFSPATYSTYLIIFLLDPDGTISEMNESNNRVTLTYILIEPSGDYLFSVDLAQCGGMSPGPVSDELKNCFSENNINLSTGAVISSLEENEWKVTDGPTEYLLSVKGGEVVIYRFEKGAERNDSPLLLIIEILGAIMTLVIIAVIVIRINRARRKDPLLDTGLVEGEEYKFRERGIKPEFDGLELDDFFEGMEEEESKKDQKKEDTIKDKGTGYYVTSQDQPGSEKPDLGFTIYKPPAELTETADSQEADHKDWEEYGTTTDSYEADEGEWEEYSATTDSYEADEGEWEEYGATTDSYKADEEEWEEYGATTDSYEADEGEWEEYDTTTDSYEADEGEWEDYSTLANVEESVESDLYLDTEKLPIFGEALPLDEDIIEEVSLEPKITLDIPETKQKLMLEPKPRTKETQKTDMKKPLMMKPVSGPVVSGSTGEKEKLDDIFGIMTPAKRERGIKDITPVTTISEKKTTGPMLTGPVVQSECTPERSRQVGRPIMKPRDESIQTAPVVQREHTTEISKQVGRPMMKPQSSSRRPMMKPRTSPRRPTMKPKADTTPAEIPANKKERPKMKPIK